MDEQVILMLTSTQSLKMCLAYLVVGVSLLWMIWKNFKGFIIEQCCSIPTPSNVSSVPGPRRQPIVGNLLQLDTQKTHESCTKWSKEFGPMYQFTLLGKKIVTISSAETLRKAFGSEAFFRHTNDRPTNITQHIFNGRKHMGFSDLCHEALGLREIIHSGVPVYLSGKSHYENAMDGSLRKLIATLVNEKDLNPDGPLRSFMADILTILLIGQTIPEDDPDHNALWELINHLYTLLDPSIEMPLKILPVLRFLPGKYGDCFRKTIQARDRVAKKYFESQKETYEHGQVRGLVDVCLKIQHEETKEKGTTWLTDDYIKGLIYDTAAAGLSEMMKTLRLLVLLSCHYQDHQSRVQLEIDDVIGSDVPTEEHRRSMPYTQAFILEMLRYVSQTPLAIPHKCNKDIVLDGYLIEKNSGILPNLWGIHHDEKIWGDPWEFRPERFLENGALLPGDHKLMQSLIPFSVGKRQCPGKNFALSRTFVILTSLLQKLRFLPSDDEPLPSADPRLYSARYPLELPVYKCKVVPRLSAEDADAEVKAEVTHRMYP